MYTTLPSEANFRHKAYWSNNLKQNSFGDNQNKAFLSFQNKEQTEGPAILKAHLEQTVLAYVRLMQVDHRNAESMAEQHTESRSLLREP